MDFLKYSMSNRPNKGTSTLNRDYSSVGMYTTNSQIVGSNHGSMMMGIISSTSIATLENENMASTRRPQLTLHSNNTAPYGDYDNQITKSTLQDYQTKQINIGGQLTFNPVSTQAPMVVSNDYKSQSQPQVLTIHQNNTQSNEKILLLPSGNAQSRQVTKTTLSNHRHPLHSLRETTSINYSNLKSR